MVPSFKSDTNIRCIMVVIESGIDIVLTYQISSYGVVGYGRDLTDDATMPGTYGSWLQHPQSLLSQQIVFRSRYQRDNLKSFQMFGIQNQISH